MFFHKGRLRRDSLEDKAFMALNISMTTRIDKDTVEADLAMSLLNISQPISGKSAEQWWNRDRCWKEIWGPSGFDSSQTNIGTNDKVADEKPPANQDFVSLARLALHDVMVRRVKGESGGRKTIGDKVDPEELDGDEGLGHAKGGSKEDGNNLTNVGRDEVADKLLGVVLLAGTEVIKFTSSIALALEVFMLRENTNLSADALCSVSVVSSDNNDPDTGFLALADRARNFLSGGVKHPDQPNKSHVLLELKILLGCLGCLRKRILGGVVNGGESNYA
ncbi:unnamed protein product [Clonostachys chloroleuca]|uniref:Uncharacterized protein n=1 Tax=Clonostachys chloroleuca TaxID=1926264 RepID=A0AA35MJL4_9HYPO|nr:unnamed protein product [Clonostachys chloroleuca]